MLKYNLTSFPTSGTLCVRNQYDVYIIKDGDTYKTIQSTNKISRTVLRSWNRFINNYYNNIASFINQTICISNPLGNYNLIKN